MSLPEPSAGVKASRSARPGGSLACRLPDGHRAQGSRAVFIDLSGKGYPTLAAAKEAGAPTVNYGVFLNTVITFIIVAFVVFLIARSFAKEPAPAPTKSCPRCTSAIPSPATRCPFCTSDVAP